MNDRMTTIWQGVEIEYNESKNRWYFTLRGRDRSTDSLAQAKDAIDKPPPKDKKPFQRQKVWVRRSHWQGRGWDVAEATSIAGGTGLAYDPFQVWTMKGAERSKESAAEVFPCNAHNDPLIAAWNVVQQRIVRLETEQKKIRKKLRCLKIDPEKVEE